MKTEAALPGHTPQQDLGCRGTVAIETHGCKLNQADSETLARRFLEAGYRLVSADQPADVYLVNTCTVTHVADSKARHALRALRRRNPSATLVATGCYAQRDPSALAAIEGVDLVLGNQDKPKLVERVLGAGIDPPPAMVRAQVPEQPYLTGRSRAMVKIQEGCNQVCAYCIVPRVRGRERSIPADMLVQQVQAREAEGYKEVVLTGTQLGSYGFDLQGQNLPGLLRRILQESRMPRLRVSSLQPQEISRELLDMWEDPRLCPHLHLPLQSGCDSVLQRMRRRYTIDLYAQTVDRIRRSVPAASVTTDMIVGFPGESQHDFDQGLAFVKEFCFAATHVFPYSRRPGTTAAHMNSHLDPMVQRQRMASMLAAAQEAQDAHVDSCMGEVRPVLWERPTGGPGDSGSFIGLTDTYLRVVTSSEKDLTNTIAPARLIERREGAIYACLVPEAA